MIGQANGYGRGRLSRAASIWRWDGGSSRRDRAIRLRNRSFSRSDNPSLWTINNARQLQSDILISLFKVPHRRQIGGFRFFGAGQQRHGDQHRRASGRGDHHAAEDSLVVGDN